MFGSALKEKEILTKFLLEKDLFLFFFFSCWGFFESESHIHKGKNCTSTFQHF